MKKYTFYVRNLDCANCANELERKIGKIENVNKVCLSFISQKLTFECEEEKKTEIFEKIKKVIQKEEPDCIVEEA